MAGWDGGRFRVLARRDSRDGRLWLAEVVGLPAASTSSRSLAALERQVRELVVRVADLPPGVVDQLRLEWSYHTGDQEVDEETARLRRRRAELAAAAAELGRRTAALAARLVYEQGFSVREAAALLGISPARVDQLVRERLAEQDAGRSGAAGLIGVDRAGVDPAGVAGVDAGGVHGEDGGADGGAAGGGVDSSIDGDHVAESLIDYVLSSFVRPRHVRSSRRAGRR